MIVVILLLISIGVGIQFDLINNWWYIAIIVVESIWILGKILKLICIAISLDDIWWWR